MILKLQNGNTVQNTDDVLIEGGKPFIGLAQRNFSAS